MKSTAAAAFRAGVLSPPGFHHLSGRPPVPGPGLGLLRRPRQALLRRTVQRAPTCRFGPSPDLLHQRCVSGGSRWDHPAGETQLSSLHPPRTIPHGCYDCGDGFYDPRTGKVTSYEGVFLRKAGQRENPNPTEGAGVVGGACGAFKHGKTGNRTN